MSTATFRLWRQFPLLTPVLLSLRNMRARWMRTLLTCLGIILGVAVILAIAIANESTLHSIRNVFNEASGKANLLVLSSSADCGGFDQSILARAQSLNGVIAAAPVVQATTLLARDAKDWQLAFGIGGRAVGNILQLYGVDAQVDPQVREYEIIAGRWLQDANYETVLTQKYAQEKHLQVGDDLVILIPQGQERLRVVGIIANNGAGLLNDGVVAFAP